MTKLKLACGSVVLMLLNFCFSSYFALTALAKLYINSIDHTIKPVIELTQIRVDAFINQQYYITLLIVSGSSVAIVTLIIIRKLPAPEHWSLKKIGLPLLSISSIAQLLAMGLYIRNLTIAVSIDKAIAAGLLDVVIEMAATLVIASLLFVELFILLLKVLQVVGSANPNRCHVVDAVSIRPAIFLFLFGVDLSAAFIPLHMKNLYQPLLDLPMDVVLGLPISAMFLCVSFTIVVAGIWLDRRGWHEPFFVGLALTASAMLYAWLAPDAVHFIIAMGLTGFGYGLALMASQGFVIVHTGEKTKAYSLAYLFAGIYAGSICGTAVGAMLAERIGYGPVFLLSAMALFLTLGYSLLTLRTAIKQAKSFVGLSGAEKVGASVTAKHYWNFLRNRYVLGLIFLSSLPSAIAVIGLLNYFGPVYLDRLGISQSVIGSILILYSICMVYLGPFVSKFIDASDNKRLFVFIGCVLGGSAFLSFHFFTGLIATVIAVLLLGVSSCFVLASQTTYALTLNVTKQLGQGRAIGIFRASSRIGQMLGPILFGWLMVYTDINQGLTYFGVAYLTTAILFLLFTFERVKYSEKVICESSPASS